MRDKVLGFVRSNWEEWGLGPRPREFDFLVLNATTVDFMIFPKGAREPVLMVKLSKDSRMRTRFDNLRKIDAVLPGLAPKPYALGMIGDYFVQVQGFITGKTLYHYRPYPDPNRIERSFRQLTSLHSALWKDDLTLGDDVFTKLVVDPVNQFAARADSSFLNDQCALLLEESNKLRNRRLPNIPQHCDLCFSNVLFTGAGEIKIIDWEDFGGTNLVCYDLFSLVNSVHLEFRSYEDFLVKSPANALLRRKIVDYCNALGVDTELISVLYPLAMVTFFNQIYPDFARLTALKVARKLIEFYFQNRGEFFVHQTQDWAGGEAG